MNKECYIVVISYQKHAGNRRLQLSTTLKMELAFMQMANHNGNRALKIKKKQSAVLLHFDLQFITS